MLQSVAKWLDTDVIDNITHEGKHQKHTSFVFGDASCAHIEESILVELTYCGSMRALYIVGIDLELRTRNHASLVGETEVTVGLMSISLDCSITHEDSSDETCLGFPIEHVLEKLVAVAMRALMVDERDVIDFLFVVGNHHSEEVGVDMFAVEIDIDTVAGLTSSEHKLAYGGIASLLLMHIDVAQTHHILLVLLEAIHVKGGTLAYKDFCDL